MTTQNIDAAVHIIIIIIIVVIIIIIINIIFIINTFNFSDNIASDDRMRNKQVQWIKTDI
jgi:hypothetical protein